MTIAFAASTEVNSLLMIVLKDIAMLLSLVKHTTFHGLSTSSV